MDAASIRTSAPRRFESLGIAIGTASVELQHAQAATFEMPYPPTLRDLRPPVLHAVRAASLLEEALLDGGRGVPPATADGMRQAVTDIREGLRELRVPQHVEGPDLSLVHARWEDAQVTLGGALQHLEVSLPAPLAR